MLSNYTIVPYISNGSFSTLYEGIHKIKQHKVVVKTHYDSISKILLENEIKIYSFLLKHKYSHIPLIKNIGHWKDTLYIIMEYKSKPLGTVSIELIDKVKRILLDLHTLNIIHRDIKPENFLMENENVYIIDFGLSTFYSHSITNGMIGNKKYCSYKCHTKHYVYEYTDDLISMVYMFLDLHNGFVPWKLDFTKKCDFKTYYPSDIINDYLFTLFEQYLSAP